MLVEEIEGVVDTVTKLDGGPEVEGSVKYQINQAKQDLIGDPGDTTSRDTINAAKNLVAESFQIIKYNN